jgi:WD repeat-containing protein 68
MAEPRKAEVYSYKAPWQIYGMNWSQVRGKPFRLALGSFIEQYTNKVCLGVT